MGILAPSQIATQSAARQCLLSDAEIVDGEVSWSPSKLSRDAARSAGPAIRRRAPILGQPLPPAPVLKATPLSFAHVKSPSRGLLGLRVVGALETGDACHRIDFCFS